MNIYFVTIIDKINTALVIALTLRTISRGCVHIAVGHAHSKVVVTRWKQMT